MTQKKRQATRTPLTRERIVSRAIGLADRSGIDALSMRKVASALRVEAMSLYNHVTNKEDLLDGMVEHVVAEIGFERSEGEPWRDAITRRAHAAHDVLLQHGWASLLLASRINVGPNMLAYVDATIGVFIDAGFSYPEADHAWNAVDNHVYGFTLQELNFPFEPSEYADAARQFLPMIPVETHPYLNGMSCAVIAGEHDGLHDFAFGLDLILDGLEQLLAG